MPHCSSWWRTAAVGLVAAVALATSAAARADDAGASVDALAAQLASDSGSLLSGVQFSGFGDFTYQRMWLKEGSLLRLSLPQHAAFAVGNLNLYADAPLSRRARSFIEVRYTYQPNGTQASAPDGTGSFPRESTVFSDYANTNTREAWGGIVIQRAFVEYSVDERLTLRVGHFLTPYGVWNVDHGSPAIVSVQRPYIVGQELIPNSQVGLEAYGVFHVGGSRLGYHATVSNGRIGDNPQYLDFDGKLGLGGRIFLENGRVGNLKLGLSGYQGRYTEARNAVGAGGVEERILEQYDELSLGADARWVVGGFDLTGEVAWNKRAFKANLPTRPDGASYDEDSRWGAYLVAGYTLPFARQVMPYVKAEYYRSSDELHDVSKPDVFLYFFGVNTHLQPNLVVKLEYGKVTFRDLDAPPFDAPIHVFFAQTAWAF